MDPQLDTYSLAWMKMSKTFLKIMNFFKYNELPTHLHLLLACPLEAFVLLPEVFHLKSCEKYPHKSRNIEFLNEAKRSETGKNGNEIFHLIACDSRFVYMCCLQHLLFQLFVKRLSFIIFFPLHPSFFNWLKFWI